MAQMCFGRWKQQSCNMETIKPSTHPTPAHPGTLPKNSKGESTLNPTTHTYCDADTHIQWQELESCHPNFFGKLQGSYSLFMENQ